MHVLDPTTDFAPNVFAILQHLDAHKKVVFGGNLVDHVVT